MAKTKKSDLSIVPAMDGLENVMMTITNLMFIGVTAAEILKAIHPLAVAAVEKKKKERAI